MGYRSEVILAVGPEVMPQFMVTMAKSPEARKMCLSEHDEMIKDYCNIKGAFLFRWDHIKWYESYEDVQTLEKFICEATSDEYSFEVDGQTQNSSEHIKFVRVGEESGDVEMSGDGFWDIYPTTHICY